jgi:DNA-directed RNA polymerase specialized sigma24 family protein
MKVHWFGRILSERGEYARMEEFVSLFERERASLRRLALLLTANSEAAKQCMMRAFRECIVSSSVSKEWVLTWTRRMVVRNAIRLVMGTEGQSFVNTDDNVNNGSMEFIPDDSLEEIVEVGSIFDLPELDRFVFVLCFLERYSNHDCALLLGRSLREIIEAQQRVEKLVGEMSGSGDFSPHFALR